MNTPQATRVLVTGASGFLGQGLIRTLAERPTCAHVVAVDVREVPPAQRLPGIIYVTQDVRDPTLADTLAAHHIDTVVHLASIVTPGKDSNRALEYSVDVGGT
ncbi:MAG: NAD-dependent epimerase/dehydratase family protein, partial [Limnohabitans sp.]